MGQKIAYHYGDACRVMEFNDCVGVVHDKMIWRGDPGRQMLILIYLCIVKSEQEL